MSDLADRPCEACRPDSPCVAAAELEALLADIPGWSIADDQGVPQLTRRFAFRDFLDALAFTNRVGALAEEADHHPSLLTEYGSVTVRWWTHTIRDLHINDFILAARTSRLFDEVADR